MRRIIIVFGLTLVTLCFVSSLSAFALENSCWGQATAVFAQMGYIGEHASQQEEPRVGLANLSRGLYEAGIIPDDSLQALGAFVANSLDMSIDECMETEQRFAGGGATTANGWYEGIPIYFVVLGFEEGVTQRGENDLYLIGGDRMYQANVAEYIPGEAGYTPHWNVNVVHTAPGVTLAAILTSPYASIHYPEALFDDVEDILRAEAADLVTIDKPGVVVLCPIISEDGAEAPGNTQLPEEFDEFTNTF
jgi:hypothetical protein